MWGEISLDAGDSINFGYSTSRFWVRFGIHNPAAYPTNAVLRISDRFLRPLQIFQRNAGGEFTEVLYVDEKSVFEPTQKVLDGGHKH